MRPVRRCRCCVPGCRVTIALTPFVTVGAIVDLTEGLCAAHLALVPAAPRQVLRAARLELRLVPGLAELVLFYRAWEAVKHCAIERAAGRLAA